MTADVTLRSAEEIHRHLIEQINLAIRRPGMFGGESELWSLFGYLDYVEGEPSMWRMDLTTWEKRGVIIPNVRSVTAAMAEHLPEPLLNAVASIFAEEAWRRGWLIPDRALPQPEYQAMHASYREWAGNDRTREDVLESFGQPCILVGGKNPRWDSYLGYCSARRTDPIIWFHLWNQIKPGNQPGAPAVFDQPVLVAARDGDDTLPRSITYSPEGEHRRPKTA